MNAAYFLTIPIVNAFNFSQVLLVPLLIALVGLVVQITAGNIRVIPVINLDRVVLAFLISVLISLLVNLPSITPKNINHAVAIYSGYVLFYWGAERFAARLGTEHVLRLLYWSYLIATGFGVVEFLIANFTSFDLSAIVFRPSVTDYTPGFLDIVLIRSRSFFEESGYFAGYLAVMIPILSYYLWHLKSDWSSRLLFIALSLAACFMAFSVSFFIFFPVSVFTAAALKIVKNGRLKISTVIVAFLLVAFAIGVLTTESIFQSVFLQKFQGNSFDDRATKFQATLDVMRNAGIEHWLFGFGPGSYENLGVAPAISVYINFLRDIGAVGLMAYLVCGGYLLLELVRNRTPFGATLLASALVAQLFFISTPIYYLPHYFLPLVFHKIMVTDGRGNA